MIYYLLDLDVDTTKEIMNQLVQKGDNSWLETKYDLAPGLIDILYMEKFVYPKQLKKYKESKFY